MRRVLRSVVGSRKNVCGERRAPWPCGPLADERGLARGEVSNTSLPSRKNSRFSGKNVSKAVRFTTTSSDSTAPKSGFKAAVSCMLVEGRQTTSTPALASFWS